MAGFFIEKLQILKAFSTFLGGGSTIVLKLKTLRYLPFFRGPSSAINFECQLLSVEPDHDYEIEKLY